MEDGFSPTPGEYGDLVNGTTPPETDTSTTTNQNTDPALQGNPSWNINNPAIMAGGTQTQQITPTEGVASPPPIETGKPDLREAIKNAELYDAVLVEDTYVNERGEVVRKGDTMYVKMPLRTADKHGGETKEHRWVKMQDLSNNHYNAWKFNPETEIWDWPHDTDIEKPETGDVDQLGITEEELLERIPVETPAEDPAITTETVERNPKVIIEEGSQLQTEEEISIVTGAASELIGDDPATRQELEEAGRDEQGFLAAIKRTFSGEKWRTWATTAATSVLGSVAAMKAAGLAVATFGGPAGAMLMGGVMLVAGGYAAVKTAQGVKEAAAARGMTWREFINQEGFAKGVFQGAVISGIAKVGIITIPMVIPGVGAIVGSALAMTALEVAKHAQVESNLNKEQTELLNAYMDSFEKRRYQKLVDQGYVERTGINVENIIRDINNPELSLEEKKTAQKTALATLKYLYEQTGDEKYRILHYTETDANGEKIRKEIDILEIGLELRDRPESTAQYPSTELTAKDPINIESFIDTLDNDELISLTNEAWTASTPEQKEGLAKEILTIFVGLEAGDVDKLLSAQRAAYLKSVATAVGMRVGTVGVNLLVTGYTAGTMIAGGAAEIMGVKRGAAASAEVQDQYRSDLSDSDATVREYQDRNGKTVNAIDLDGDGTHDLVHSPDTGEYYAQTTAGAEKVFEVQNPTLGDVTVNEFPSSNTGITGTVLNASGQVVGVVQTDPTTGGVSVMNTSELSSNLGGSLTTGGAAPIAITGIQPDGTANISVNGVDHSVSLAQLDSIPEIPAVAGVDAIPGGSVMTVDPNNSVPSLLDRMLSQAKTYNPGLADADTHALQTEYLYKNHGAYDSAIRAELGLSNPVQPGEQFDITKSETVMSWLQELNGGTPVTFPPGTSGIPGSAGSPGIDFSFNPDVANLQLETPILDSIPAGGFDIIAPAAMAAAAFLAPNQTGNIMREVEATLNGQAVIGGTPPTGDNSGDDSASQNTTSTTTTSVQQETPTSETPTTTEITPSERARSILVSEIFSISEKTSRTKIYQSTRYQTSSGLIKPESAGIWTVDGETKDAEEVAQIIMTESREVQESILTKMLTYFKGDESITIEGIEYTATRDRRYEVVWTSSTGPIEVEDLVNKILGEQQETGTAGTSTSTPEVPQAQTATVSTPNAQPTLETPPIAVESVEQNAISFEERIRNNELVEDLKIETDGRIDNNWTKTAITTNENGEEEVVLVKPDPTQPNRLLRKVVKITDLTLWNNDNNTPSDTIVKPEQEETDTGAIKAGIEEDEKDVIAQMDEFIARLKSLEEEYDVLKGKLPTGEQN